MTIFLDSNIKQHGLLDEFEKEMIRKNLQRIQCKVVNIEKGYEYPLKSEESKECYAILYHFICNLADLRIMSFNVVFPAEIRVYEKMSEGICYSLEELGL